MVDQLINGIAQKLTTVFGDAYTIHTREVDEAQQTSCLIVSLLQSERQARLGGRMYQSSAFDIRYYPPAVVDYGDMIAVGETMMTELALITLYEGDLAGGVRRKYEIVDGVLHFLVTYNLHLEKSPVETTPMQELGVQTGTMKG